MEFRILKPGTPEADAQEFVKKWFAMYHSGAITETHLMSRLADFALDMRDPDYEIKGKKEFIVDLGGVEEIDTGYVVIGRNGDLPWKVGEFINNCRIEKILAYGREFEELSPGHTAALVLKGKHLSFSMRPYKFDWSWRHKDDQADRGV